MTMDIVSHNEPHIARLTEVLREGEVLPGLPWAPGGTITRIFVPQPERRAAVDGTQTVARVFLDTDGDCSDAEDERLLTAGLW